LQAYLVDLQGRPPQLYRKLRQDGQTLLAPSTVQPATVQNYLAGLRVLLKALEWAGINKFTLDNLTAPADPTPPENRRSALPEVTYKQELLNHLQGNEPPQIGMRIIVRLMGEMGLRIAEVCGLEVDRIDLATRLLEVKGNGGKIRPVPIPKSLVSELRQWLKLRTAHARAGTKELIVNLGNRRARGLGTKPDQVRKQLEALYTQLHLPDRYYGAYMLRHTAGTRIYKKNNRDLMTTSRILGHANLNTAGIYAKMDAEGLLEAIDNTEE
jgi:integrase/recombinase XerC